MQTGQEPLDIAIAVSGVAGSGKSTLGRAIAVALRLPLVDLDTVTNPLLESFPPEVLGGHWLASKHAVVIRTGRYASLLALARDVVPTARGIVMVAPFTAELQGGIEWQALRSAVEPARLLMIRLEGDAELLASRRAVRNEVRDTYRPATQHVADPLVPVITIAAQLDQHTQLDVALSRIAADQRQV